MGTVLLSVMLIVCAGGAAFAETDVPNQPMNFQAVANQQTHTITFTWTDTSGIEDGFWLQRRVRNLDGTWPAWHPAAMTQIANANETRFVVKPGLFWPEGLTEFRLAAAKLPLFSSWTRSVKVWVLYIRPQSAHQVQIAPGDVPGTLTILWANNAREQPAYTDGIFIQRRLMGLHGDWGPWRKAAIVPPDADEYTDTPPQQGWYQYRLRPYNRVGPGNWAPIHNFTALAANQAPNAPSDVTASFAGVVTQQMVGPDRIRVSWQDRAWTEEKFEIQRRMRQGGWLAWQAVTTIGRNKQRWVDTTVGEATYQYRIRAKNFWGESEWVESPTVSTGGGGGVPATTPQPPSDFVAQLVEDPADTPGTGPYNVQLNWTDNATDEAGFVLQRRAMNADGSWAEWSNDHTLSWLGMNVQQYLDWMVEPSRWYHYRLRAYNRAGPSVWQQVRIYVPAHPLPTEKPAAPDNFTIRPVPGFPEFALRWRDNSDNEAGFVVQRRKQTGVEVWSGWETVGHTYRNRRDLQDNPPMQGHYQYRVRAFNAAGPSNWARNVTAWLLYGNPPYAPQDTSAGINASGNVLFTWLRASECEEGFLVQRRQYAAGAWSPWQTMEKRPAFTEQYTDVTVQPGGDYQYRVRAFNRYGASNWAPRVRITVPAIGGAALCAVSVTQVNGQAVSVVYRLAAAADVTVEVRNIAGRMVKTIPCGTASAGINTATWNLRNSAGATVPAGTYLCTVTARSEDGTQASAVRTVSLRR